MGGRSVELVQRVPDPGPAGSPIGAPEDLRAAGNRRRAGWGPRRPCPGSPRPGRPKPEGPGEALPGVGMDVVQVRQRLVAHPPHAPDPLAVRFAELPLGAGSHPAHAASDRPGHRHDLIRGRIHESMEGALDVAVVGDAGGSGAEGVGGPVVVFGLVVAPRGGSSLGTMSVTLARGPGRLSRVESPPPPAGRPARPLARSVARHAPVAAASASSARVAGLDDVVDERAAARRTAGTSSSSR